MVTVQGNCVCFRFYRPGASNVHLVGDFNGWRQGELRMVRAEGGYWTATMGLVEGTYRFRYLADGAWFTDYAAFGIEYNAHGVDSVVRVSRPRRAGKVQAAAMPQATVALSSLAQQATAGLVAPRPKMRRKAAALAGPQKRIA